MLLSIKALLSYSFHLMFIVKDIAKIENLVNQLVIMIDIVVYFYKKIGFS